LTRRTRHLIADFEAGHTEPTTLVKAASAIAPQK